MLWLLMFSVYATNEPPLPQGLVLPGEALPSAESPLLPEGLGTKTFSQEPSFKRNDTSMGEKSQIDGFLEARAGTRIQNDRYQKKESLAELRLQLRTEHEWDWAVFKGSVDFIYDDVADNGEINLEKGTGPVDLREASILLRPGDRVDIKAGRQILTWGTGDLLFIHDMFPKDWNSFFIGRDDEYLKAPSDALRVSLYPLAMTLECVYTPEMDADRFIDGTRISYYNPARGRTSGREAPLRPDDRNEVFHDDEWALRLLVPWQSTEMAFYVYRGFWKTPEGIQDNNQLYYPKLHVYGFSLRSPCLGGIGSVEAGYYDSREDPHGTHPFVRNSEFRWMTSFEKEIARNLTAGVQYYEERMSEYDAYQRYHPQMVPMRDEIRRLFTLRLTRLCMQQNLRLSLFAFYSPTDRDYYLRPKFMYTLNDRWSVYGGANVFFGDLETSFFAQFEEATNVYSGVRVSF